MSLFNVLDISGTAMSAQNIRLNTTASNIANANTVSSNTESTYRARHTVFATALQNLTQEQNAGSGVQVMGVVEDQRPLQVEYMPNHPMADEKGYIYKPNVNVVEEMTNMISASRGYQTNVQVADTAKQMFQRTLMLGRR